MTRSIGLIWAAFIASDDRPAILNQKHSDWPKLLRWVPRSWTAWLGDYPRKLWGNAPVINQLPEPPRDRPIAPTAFYPKPIPDAGQWWIGLPLYAAVKSKGGWYFRVGFRWDDNDWYYSLSVALKRYRS